MNEQLKILKRQEESAEKWRISGRITVSDGAGGGPLRNAQLYLFSTKEPMVLSDDKGEFVFPGVPSGHYWIIVRNNYTNVSGRGLINVTGAQHEETDVIAAEIAYKVESDEG